MEIHVKKSVMLSAETSEAKLPRTIKWLILKNMKTIAAFRNQEPCHCSQSDRRKFLFRFCVQAAAAADGDRETVFLGSAALMYLLQMDN